MSGGATNARRPTAADRLRNAAPLAVGLLFAGSGVLHLLRPEVFRPLMPPSLPGPDAWIYASGVAEIICSYGLLTRRPWAGKAGAALLLAVWPGNISMALDSGSGRLSGAADDPVVAWGRVPLQIPLIWAALQSRPHGAQTPRRRPGLSATGHLRGYSG